MYKMYKYESREEVWQKIDWEGGIIDALDYGLRSESMPDEELREAWAAMEAKYRELEPLVTAVWKLVDFDVNDGPGNPG